MIDYTFLSNPVGIYQINKIDAHGQKGIFRYNFVNNAFEKSSDS